MCMWHLPSGFGGVPPVQLAGAGAVAALGDYGQWIGVPAGPPAGSGTVAAPGDTGKGAGAPPAQQAGTGAVAALGIGRSARDA